MARRCGVRYAGDAQTGSRPVIVGGIGAAAAVALFGNLDAFGQVAGSLRDGLGLRGAMDRFDFWESTRIIPGTINEFPFFSGLWADLHAHVIALPFALLMAAVSLAVATYWRDTLRTDRIVAPVGVGWPASSRCLRWRVSWSGRSIASTHGTSRRRWSCSALGLVVGLRDSGRNWPRTLGLAALGTVGTGVAGYILYLPFFQHFQSLYGSLARVRQPTPLGEFLVIFGLPCAVIAVGVALLCPGGGWLRALMVDVRCRIVGAAGALGVIASAWSHRYVLLVTLPLLTLAAIVWFRSERQPGRRMALGLAGAGLGLLSVIEIVFLADDLIGSDFERMNTVFKFDYQAWWLLMLGAIGVVSIIIERWHATPPAAQVGVSTLLALGIILVALLSGFRFAVAIAPTDEARCPPMPGWMASRGCASGSVPADQFNNSGSGEPVYFKDDLALIDYLNTNDPRHARDRGGEHRPVSRQWVAHFQRDRVADDHRLGAARGAAARPDDPAGARR